MRSTRLTCDATTAGSQPSGRGEDERHADDLVVEVGAVHVVRALHLRLVVVALAPRLAVVGDERDRRLLAQAEVVERLEEPREERLGLALHRLPVARVQRLERGRVAGLDARDDVLLRLPPLLALGVEDAVRHVRRPAVEPEAERRRSRARAATRRRRPAARSCRRRSRRRSRERGSARRRRSSRSRSRTRPRP